jgi:hypothetical protein
MFVARIMKFLLASFVVVGVLASTLLLHHVTVASAAAPAPTATPPPTTTYTLPGGKIWGHLQKLNRMTDYQVADTHFTGDPATVNASLQQPEYFRVLQNTDGSEPLAMTLTMPGHPLTTIHFAVNPHEHTSLIAVGVPTAAFLQHNHVYANSKGSAAYQSASSQAAPEPTMTGNVLAQTIHAPFQPANAQSWQSSHYIDTVWTDPAFIPVAEVQTSMTCTVDGTYVLGCSGSDWRYWLSNDGWYEYSHSIGTSYPASDRGLTWTHDHFRNKPFCAGNWTDIYFHDSEVDIFSDSSWYANLSTDQTGACGWLLSYSDTLY